MTIRSLANVCQSKITFSLVASLALSLSIMDAAQAMAIRGGFSSNTLPPNDDGSTGSVNIGFGADFFGTTYNSLFVNNNGNVTFDSSLSTFTPFNLNTTNRAIIAPFFADVDTRAVPTNGSQPVTYGTGTVDGRNAFGVNWVDVGHYLLDTDPLNSFQLVLVDRSDIGVGDFDFEFNYDTIGWETGSASGGTNGLGGNSARVGYSNGSTVNFELAGSAINGAFLDGGPNSLIGNSLNAGIDGRYVFNVRNGVVQPTDVPTPAAVLPGLIGMATAAMKKRKEQLVGEEA